MVTIITLHFFLVSSQAEKNSQVVTTQIEIALN